ncbi:FAD-dependent oxidoreductase [Candidatus Pacearchaeota archaeon]|nr:FAD-dependent oxidoreductase [Candidatus Pacearchaeota archaeon]
MIKIFSSKVLDKKMLNNSVVNLKYSLPDDFSFKPGQYLSITRVVDGKKLRTPYSIATTPGKGFGEFCTRVIKVGKTSEYLSTLDKGDEIELFGPLGKFTVADSSKQKDTVFISSGTGISAFVSMIPNLLQNGFKKKIILIKGFRNEEEILYDELFVKLQEDYRNFKFYNVLSQPKEKYFDHKGYVQDFLERFVPNLFKGHFYLCGLTEMIDQTTNKLKGQGVTEDRIFFEKYD